jgi:hypothetical protein
MINSPVIASLAEHMMVCAGAAVKNDFLPLDRHVALKNAEVRKLWLLDLAFTRLPHSVSREFHPENTPCIPLYHTLERRMTKLRIGSPSAKFDFGKSSGSVNIALFRFS